MNPITLYLASGESLFTGGLLLIVAALLSFRKTSKWGLRFLNLLAWIALAMIVMASAPFHWAIYGGLAILFLAWFVAANARRLHRSSAHKTFAALLISLLLFMGITELRFRPTPVLAHANHRALYVVGDSISSGIVSGYPPWPEVFQNTYGIHVVNLSQPGIGAAEAVAPARKIPDDDALVLIEIGGNDLLSGESTEDFRKDLLQLMTALWRPQRTLVMMELPLLPHRMGYGQVQRDLAEKYHVTLIPKRHFIHVLGGADATSDGLHLSEAGTKRMAEFVHEIVGPALVATPQSNPH